MSSLYVWDFTLSVAASTDDESIIIDELKELAKKWVFQLEDSQLENDNQSILDDFEQLSGGTLGFDSDIQTQGSTLENDSDSVESMNLENLDNFEQMSGGTLTDDSISMDDSELSISSFSSRGTSADFDENGYIHFQGRISLFKRKTKKQLLHILETNDLFMQFASFRPTNTTAVLANNFSYAMKLDTRIDGPWADNDEPAPYIPKQIKMIEALRPWQQEIIDRSLYMWNTRYIDVLVDKDGCLGKTTLAMYCATNRIGRNIPSLNNYLDLMQCVMCMPISKLYFIDMPKALNKQKFVEFFAAIESIKNGFAFDKRYKYVEKYFDSPSIWLFTNMKPDDNLLSKDRWRYWAVEDNELYMITESGGYEKGPTIEYPSSESENDDESCDGDISNLEDDLSDKFDEFLIDELSEVVSKSSEAEGPSEVDCFGAKQVACNTDNPLNQIDEINE